jgi:hypothetical protein
MIKSLPWVSLLLALLATGCTSMDTDTYGRKEGWRKARVVEVGGIDSPMKTLQTDCRSELGPNPPYTRFAVVSYNVRGSPRHKARRISAVPNELNLQADDLVYVNIQNCLAPLRKRDVLGNTP